MPSETERQRRAQQVDQYGEEIDDQDESQHLRDLGVEEDGLNMNVEEVLGDLEDISE